MKDPLASLPHGPEFRFLDRILQLEPGRQGVGEYRVKPEETFLRGHFPGNPILPGVLMCEAAAQLAGTVAQSDPQVPPLPGLKLTAVRNLKILGVVKPGEVLRVEARIVGRLENLVEAEVTGTVNGQVVLKGALTLSGEGGKYGYFLSP